VNPKGLTQISLHYLLIEILIRLFTLGIFSVEGGIKAWFELLLVSAALCACGYILWWQIPFLIIVIILGPIALGMFSVIVPIYTKKTPETPFISPKNPVITILKYISNYNLHSTSNFSADQLQQYLEKTYKAEQIFKRHPKLIEQIPEIQSIVRNIETDINITSNKLEVYRQKEENRKKEEAELNRKEYEAKQERLKKEALTKAARKSWLDEQRRINKFTHGCPPDDEDGELICREPYPVKVGSKRTKDGYDGIIWEPCKGKYKEVIPLWCYQSVSEAQKEKKKNGDSKFRVPNYKKNHNIKDRNSEDD